MKMHEVAEGIIAIMYRNLISVEVMDEYGGSEEIDDDSVMLNWNADIMPEIGRYIEAQIEQDETDPEGKEGLLNAPPEMFVDEE